VCDDFIQNFTADAFNPKDRVDLFADAGATYFVQVSKHHDGYAIFDLLAKCHDENFCSPVPSQELTASKI
jgi:alpha-L-fucosidase